MEIMLMRAKLATRSKWIKSRRLVQSLNQRLLDALDRNIRLEAEISSISFDAASFASELEARCDSVCQMNYLSERTMSELTKAQDNLCELEIKFVSISLERDQLLIQMAAAKSEKMCQINEVQCENRNLENVKNSAQSEKVELETKLESYLFIHEDLISRASEIAVQLDAAKTRVSFYERRLELVSKYVMSLEDKATLLETQLEKTLSSNIALEQVVSNRRRSCLELEKAVATHQLAKGFDYLLRMKI
jgi:chromosome segregation ATPase